MQINIDLKHNNYNVFINELSLIEFSSKVAIITNAKVAGLYVKELLKFIKASEIFIITIPDGEKYKNFNTVNSVLEELFINNLDRNSFIVSLGGGVVSDIAGFVAGIYKRGIRYINIPTTLLAQVDASVGGKTGINNDFGKNLIGLFNQPKAVYCETRFLKTLDKRELDAGFGEIIKMAVMFDKEFFKYLQNCDLENLNYEKIVAKTVSLKAKIVLEDEKESGKRMLLNYGHTFAHAIERITNYKEFLHGEAVGIGINMANLLACKLGILNLKDAADIKDLLLKFNLPISFKINNENEFYELLKSDKKSNLNKIKFVFADKIGSNLIKDDITENEILDFLRELK